MTDEYNNIIILLHKKNVLVLINNLSSLIYIGLKVARKKWKEINPIKKTKEKNIILRRKSVVVHRVVVRVVAGKNYYFLVLIGLLLVYDCW